jgi:hypothetical protein
MVKKESRFVPFGAFIKKKDGGYYIKLDKEVTLNINGKLYNNGYINVDKPEDKLKFFLDQGYIDEGQFEDRKSRIPDFVKFELTAVHAKDD